MSHRQENSWLHRTLTIACAREYLPARLVPKNAIDPGAGCRSTRKDIGLLDEKGATISTHVLRISAGRVLRQAQKWKPGYKTIRQ